MLFHGKLTNRVEDFADKKKPDDSLGNVNVLRLLNVYRIICFAETFVYTSTISAYPSLLLRELKRFGILHTVVIPFS